MTLRSALSLQALILVTSSASASAVELAWDAPDSCPSAEAAKNAVHDALRLPDGKAARISALRASVDQRDGVWLMSLSLRAGSSDVERKFEAQSCDDLVRAMALATSLVAEEPESALPRSAPGPRPADSDEQLPHRVSRESSKPDELQAAASTSRSGEDMQWLLRAGPVLDGATLPQLAPGLWLGASWAVGDLELGVGGAFFAEGAQFVAPRQTVRWSLWIVELLGCRRWRWGVIDGRACVGGEGGRVGADSTQLASLGRSVRRAWWAPLIGAEASFPVFGRLSGFAGGRALFPLERPTFVVNETSRVHRSGAVGWRVSAGLELQFD